MKLHSHIASVRKICYNTVRLPRAVSGREIGRETLRNGDIMITIEEYKKIVSELMDELPEDFFRELNGGVIVSEAAVIPDYARNNDLCTLGQYQFYSGIRQIVMFKGSFDRVYPTADTEEARMLLRGVLRHEFRHHLESLGGVRNSASLEAEDERRKEAYLSRHRDNAPVKRARKHSKRGEK